jgi:hypothetical protein
MKQWAPRKKTDDDRDFHFVRRKRTVMLQDGRRRTVPARFVYPAFERTTVRAIEACDSAREFSVGRSDSHSKPVNRAAGPVH